MELKQVAKISNTQDGAIYGSELFSLNDSGVCTVFDISKLSYKTVEELTPIAKFKLDKADEISPHSNAVCFGCEFYDKNDLYPLLYTNIYNNYAETNNKMLGTCLVHRIKRVGGKFHSTLVQIIEIGFCEDAELWKASPTQHGVRPFGNFVIDNETHSYWAFVMRNSKLGTRYFKFNLPSSKDGEMDRKLKVKKVVLGKDDIKEYFDGENHHFSQGATIYKGKIYSAEGFSDNEEHRPAFRIIDLVTKEENYYDIMALGFKNEPELIDFYNNKCHYSDAHGNLYVLTF